MPVRSTLILIFSWTFLLNCTFSSAGLDRSAPTERGCAELSDCGPECLLRLIRSVSRGERCASELLIDRCDEGGREALSEFAQTQAATALAPNLLAAVEACPSADAALALSIQRGANEKELEAVLRPLLAHPGPKTQAIAKLHSLRVARAEALAEQEIEPILDEPPTAPLQDFNEAMAQSALGKAALFLSNGDFTQAKSLANRASDYGADTKELLAYIRDAEQAAARAHLKQAWNQVRANKPEEARSERTAAIELGEDDPLLEGAIAQTPAETQRLREKQRQEFSDTIDNFIDEHFPTQADGATELTTGNGELFGTLSSNDLVAFTLIASGEWRQKKEKAAGDYQRELVARDIRSNKHAQAFMTELRRSLGARRFYISVADTPLWTGKRFFLPLVEEDLGHPFHMFGYRVFPLGVLVSEHRSFVCTRERGVRNPVTDCGACGIPLDALPKRLWSVIENEELRWRFAWTGLGRQRHISHPTPFERTTLYSVVNLQLELISAGGTKIWNH